LVLRGFVELVQLNKLNVVVDNTNTTLAEIAPYISLASAYGYEVEVVHFPCTLSVSFQRNTHGVPMTTIEKMNANLKGTLAMWPVYWPKPTVIRNP
jgi:predicted kinase